MTATQPLAIPVTLPAPPMMKGVTKDVKIVRMSRGRRMSEEAFNSLSEKDKIRVLRNRRQIAKHYVRTWFWIDFISVLPIDIIVLILGLPSMDNLKVMRIIRLFRLLKLIRVLRASRMISRWENYFAVSYAKQALMKFFITLLFSSHMMACSWGLLGMQYSKANCGGEGVDEKVIDANDPFVVDPGLEGIHTSWIVQLYNAKTSIDSPCDPFVVYIWSLHWSVMTITSIGYGDISPVHFWEYLLCILSQFSGGLLWAYIIGSICGVASNLDPHETAFKQLYDNLNYMMEDQDLPQPLRLRIREYYRECAHMQRVKSYRELTNLMSIPLRGEVALHTYYKAVLNVKYFKDCCRDFLIEVALSLEGMVYAPREFFPQFGRLWVIDRGAACREGIVFVPGAVFGEDMVIDALQLQNKATALALTFCEVQCLTKVRLTEIVKDYPREAKIIRKAAIKMAFQRAVRIFIQNHKASNKRSTMAAAFMRNAVHLQSDDQINRQYRRASRLLDNDISIADLAAQQNTGAVKPFSGFKLQHSPSSAAMRSNSAMTRVRDVSHNHMDHRAVRILEDIRDEIRQELSDHLVEVKRLIAESTPAPAARPPQAPHSVPRFKPNDEIVQAVKKGGSHNSPGAGRMNGSFAAIGQTSLGPQSENLMQSSRNEAGCCTIEKDT